MAREKNRRKSFMFDEFDDTPRDMESAERGDYGVRERPYAQEREDEAKSMVSIGEAQPTLAGREDKGAAKEVRRAIEAGFEDDREAKASKTVEDKPSDTQGMADEDMCMSLNDKGKI